MLKRTESTAARSLPTGNRGRKSRATRNPQQTRARILRIATQEFSTAGFEGARVDRIAAKCRVSKNVLYYHFGGKEALFVAALEGAYEKFRKRQAELNLDPTGPVESMRQLIHHTFWALFDNPEVIRLLNEENLHNGRHIRRSKRIRELYDPLLARLKEIIEQGIQQGIFRRDLEPKFVYISLSSLAYHYVSNRYTLEFALEIALTSDAYRQRWLDHITDMIIAHCQAVD